MTEPEIDKKSNDEVDIKKIASTLLKFILVILTTVIIFIISLIPTERAKERMKRITKNESKNTNNNIIPNSHECKNSVKYGDIDICLPEIDGMTECYKLPVVRSLADNTSTKEMPILAFYLNNETFKNIKNIGKIYYDDYFIVFGPKDSENIHATQSDLDKIILFAEKEMSEQEWSNIKNKIKDKIGEGLSVGKAVLIESYSLNDNIRTEVTITRLKNDEFEKVVMSLINYILIRDRLIIIAYYKNYDGLESVKVAKVKNDYSVLLLLNENK